MILSESYECSARSPHSQSSLGKKRKPVEGFCGELGLGEIEKDGLKVTQVLDASLESAKLWMKVIINQVDSGSTRNQNKENNIYPLQDIA